MKIDGTVFLHDWMTPAERLSGHYREVSRALRDRFEAEDKAKKLLEEAGYKVIRGEK